MKIFRKDGKLTKKFKLSWLEALRSGDYTQGTGFLYNLGDHCCLGVACRVAGASEFDLNGYALPCSYVKSKRDDAVISKADGLRLESLEVDYGEATTTTLYRLNDNIGYSFREIADLIEEQL